ncbi:MAG: class I SAM-dependent methyltransferase [Bacteroidetes bacterium]|nr:class I SAM-dependent methyltransferase [Bacteroidota bacterium]
MSEFIDPKLTSPFYFARKGLYQAALDFSKYVKGGRLLDFGCGGKPYKSLMNVSEYIGLDYENEGHPHQNEQIDVLYDGGKLPFKNEQFDYILCTEVFEHLFDLDEKLIEFNRVLKSNGLIFVTCPFIWNEHEVPFDYARYTMFALNHKFEKNNFEVVSCYKSGTFIETYTQLFFTYFSKKEVRYKSNEIGLFKKCVIFLINLFGKGLSKLLPNNESIYLTNVFIAKKIEPKITGK